MPLGISPRLTRSATSFFSSNRSHPSLLPEDVAKFQPSLDQIQTHSEAAKLAYGDYQHFMDSAKQICDAEISSGTYQVTMELGHKRDPALKKRDQQFSACKNHMKLLAEGYLSAAKKAHDEETELITLISTVQKSGRLARIQKGGLPKNSAGKPTSLQLYQKLNGLKATLGDPVASISAPLRDGTLLSKELVQQRLLDHSAAIVKAIKTSATKGTVKSIAEQVQKHGVGDLIELRSQLGVLHELEKPLAEKIEKEHYQPAVKAAVASLEASINHMKHFFEGAIPGADDRMFTDDEYYPEAQHSMIIQARDSVVQLQEIGEPTIDKLKAKLLEVLNG